MFTQIKKAWNHPYTLTAKREFKAYIRALRSTLNQDLFEASPEFWSYQISGTSILVGFIFLLNAIFAPAYLWNFYTLGTVVGGAGFFFTGFVLRRHYKAANWETQTHTMMLLRTFASCIFFGFCIATALTIICMTLFFDDFYRFATGQNLATSPIGSVVGYLFRNWFFASFYIMCWMMLYIGITSRRKTKQIEIDNLRLQNSLKEAELSSLSNQLNPHFLFNALNNIRFMIHEDANNAEKMLMSLSSVLRYSLDSSKNERVLFKDELEISNRYIDLIRIQFEERLDFIINIPDQLLDCKLPPMVLQMLLENAVKHGIDNIREGGTINVDAKLVEQTMTIDVCNDLPEDYESKRKEPGIGLFNIGQRLDLLYAGHGSIETRVLNKRFCVTVEIPQE